MNDDLQTLLEAEVKAHSAYRSDRQFDKLPLDDLLTFADEGIVMINSIIDDARRKAAPIAVNVGRALVSAKNRLPQGEFQAWLKRSKHLKSISTAKLYMQLSRHADNLKKRGVDISNMSI